MLDTPRITQTEAQHAATVRLTIPRAEIQREMGRALEEVMAAIEAQGIAPAGPFFSHHLKMDPEVFDFEVGVPVAEPVSAAGRVRASALPGARVAQAVYQGPYEGLGAAWGAFTQWIEAEGHRRWPNLWERYVQGPESSPDPATWRTELNCPVVG